jgi:hypothetical protein
VPVSHGLALKFSLAFAAQTGVKGLDQMLAPMFDILSRGSRSNEKNSHQLSAVRLSLSSRTGSYQKADS